MPTPILDINAIEKMSDALSEAILLNAQITDSLYTTQQQNHTKELSKILQQLTNSRVRLRLTKKQIQTQLVMIKEINKRPELVEMTATLIEEIQRVSKTNLAIYRENVNRYNVKIP